MILFIIFFNKIFKKKRLLHFALMKFIKTQYNKKFDILIKNSKSKDFFSRYNNLNLLPYLKKQLYKKHIDKNMALELIQRKIKFLIIKAIFLKLKILMNIYQKEILINHKRKLINQKKI